jgi:glycosyltransferase involved in cell wall biosynthesis
VRNLERKAFERADLVLFKTDADRIAASRSFGINQGKCLIVPYGIKQKRQPASHPETRRWLMEENNILPDEKILLFAGSADHEPNMEALAIIRLQILPLLQKMNFRFRLIICGNLPAKKLNALNSIPKVIAKGFVPSIEEYLDSADVFINPVVSGSGVQSKNIEAIANGCNVVTTQFGATGLPSYLTGNKVFVSPNNDWKQFAINIAAASTQKAIVPQQFYYDYNWEKVIDRFLQQAALKE